MNKSNTLHSDIIARIDAIASGPEDRAKRIKRAEDYAQLFTNCPAYSEFAKRMAGPGHVQVNRPGTDTVVIEQPPQGCYLSPNKLVCSVETHTASTVDEQQDKAMIWKKENDYADMPKTSGISRFRS